MRTNKEKFEYYWNLLQARDHQHIIPLVPNPMPAQYYYVAGYKGIGCRMIDYVKYDHGIYPDAEHPTRQDIAAVQRLLDAEFTFDPAKVLLHWHMDENGHRWSGADELSKIDGLSLAWTREELAPELQRQKELYEPRPGRRPCDYCGKQRLPEDLRPGHIWGESGTRYYCRDESCLDRDQMGHDRG